MERRERRDRWVLPSSLEWAPHPDPLPARGAREQIARPLAPRERGEGGAHRVGDGRVRGIWVISISDAGVEERVAEVDEQVDQHVSGGKDEYDPLDDRVIAAQDRIDCEPAEPRD